MIDFAVESAPSGYVRPRSMIEALEAMARPGARAAAGCTDLYPAHVGRPMAQPLVDLSCLAELRGIAVAEDSCRIGGATTWSEIARADLPRCLDGLRQAARQVGSLQVQNRGTIAGNLCNASPAADGVPPLLALDAAVELRSRAGLRRMSLAEFLTGYRTTALRQDEILAAVVVPLWPAASRSAFLKLGARRYLVISIVMAAAVVERDERGRIRRAAVAVGAASPVARRLAGLERDLVGLAPGRPPSGLVSARHMAPLSPIDDGRASAHYRSEAAIAIVGDALDRAAGVDDGA